MATCPYKSLVNSVISVCSSAKAGNRKKNIICDGYFRSKYYSRNIKKKWKTKNTTLSEQFQYPISNIQIVRDKIDTPNTQICDRSLSWLGTSTSIKSGRVKLVLWAQTSSLIGMMQSCMCFSHASIKMPTLEYNWKQCYYKGRYNREHYT